MIRVILVALLLATPASAADELGNCLSSVPGSVDDRRDRPMTPIKLYALYLEDRYVLKGTPMWGNLEPGGFLDDHYKRHPISLALGYDDIEADPKNLPLGQNDAALSEITHKKGPKQEASR